jgi:hypothetical protein
MKTITKALVGTVAAGAMAMASATPAMAQYRDRDRDRDGIDVGDVIAGALIIGGIAAVASAAGRGRGYDDGYVYEGRGYDRGYDRGYYNRAGNPRAAVEQCVYAAERNASRYSWGGRAEVTDIRNIDRRRDGYTIRGRIAVNSLGRDWRRGDRYYGRGWDNDYRGWNNGYRGWDSGRFTCDVRYGRVVDLDYSGIRGL